MDEVNGPVDRMRVQSFTLTNGVIKRTYDLNEMTEPMADKIIELMEAWKARQRR